MLLLYSFPIADSLWILEVSFLFRCPNVNTKKAISFVRLAGMNSRTSGQTLQNSIHKTVYDFFFLNYVCQVSVLFKSNPFFFFLHMSSSLHPVLYFPPSSTGPFIDESCISCFYVDSTQAGVILEEDPQYGMCLHQTGLQVILLISD